MEITSITKEEKSNNSNQFRPQNDTTKIMFSLALLQQTRAHTAKMTTILIKILVESFAFNRQKKAHKTRNDNSEIKIKQLPTVSS